MGEHERLALYIDREEWRTTWGETLLPYFPYWIWTDLIKHDKTISKLSLCEPFSLAWRNKNPFFGGGLQDFGPRWPQHHQLTWRNPMDFFGPQMCPFREAGVTSFIPAWSNNNYSIYTAKWRAASRISHLEQFILFTVIWIHTWTRRQ